MNMQLPLGTSKPSKHPRHDLASLLIPWTGRTMRQCIRATEQLSITPQNAAYNNASYSPSTYATVLRRPPPDNYQPHPPLPPLYSHQVPILPRPVNGSQAQTQVPPQPPDPPRSTGPPMPKKRGRPSRADRAKRELRPLLPQHMMQRQSTEPRQILPASASTSAVPNSERPTQDAAANTSRGKKRRRAASAEAEASVSKPPMPTTDDGKLTTEPRE